MRVMQSLSFTKSPRKIPGPLLSIMSLLYYWSSDRHRAVILELDQYSCFFLDWVDIVLTAAKLCKYMSFKRNDGWQFLADRLFEVFVVSFFITRNGILNYVAYACLVDFEHAPLKALVLMLVGIMTYWLVLIIKAAIHQIFGDGSVDDLRESDDEEESNKQK